MKLAILESPYAGDVIGNVTYARTVLGRLVRRGYAAIASHLLYTQPGVLDDELPHERALGIEAGLAWREVADISVFAAGRGWSPGMLGALESARLQARPYVVVDGTEPDRTDFTDPDLIWMERLAERAHRVWPHATPSEISLRMTLLSEALEGVGADRMCRAMEAALVRLVRDAS